MVVTHCCEFVVNSIQFGGKDSLGKFMPHAAGQSNVRR